MATVDKAFADRVVAANGVLYPDDPFEPPIQRLVEYTDMGGKLAYGMTLKGQDPEKYLRASEFIRSPRVFWDRAA